MSATIDDAPVPVLRGRGRSKLDLQICWVTMPAFYVLFGIIFVPLARVMPPPRPGVSDLQVQHFFHAHATTIKIGFGLLMVCIGLSAVQSGLVAYQIKRMTVGSALAYAYIASIAVGALPGCLLGAFSFLLAVYGTWTPHVLHLLYNLTFLSFVGSLGCFATNYLVLAVAILLDRNRIFPRWMAYVSVWNVVTELLAAPVFIFRKGAFAWNGAISFWEGTLIFGIYITCLIMLLRRAVEQQPVGEVAVD